MMAAVRVIPCDRTEPTATRTNHITNRNQVLAAIIERHKIEIAIGIMIGGTARPALSKTSIEQVGRVILQEAVQAIGMISGMPVVHSKIIPVMIVGLPATGRNGTNSKGRTSARLAVCKLERLEFKFG